MSNGSQKQIGAKTELFSVFGHPIGHTLSPAMHNAAFKAMGLDALYLAFDVPPARLMNTLEVMAELGFRGINLTVPLKEEAFRNIATLSESARILGSVNTVKMAPGGLEGHSTDGDGFLMGIKEAFDLSVKGLDVMVLGCGGAGRAVAIAAARVGAERLLITDLDEARAKKLSSEINAFAGAGKARAVAADAGSWRRASLDAELVVQATPVGMRPDDKPLLGADAFRSGQCVYDLVYMFPETGMMKAARSAGARTANGLNMLLFQGVRSFTIWTGKDEPVDVMRRVLEEAVYGRS